MSEALFATDCPSCGAPVRSHSATSVTLVCGYCRSLLVRRDDSLTDSGRDSALLEDFSPLQIGTTGIFATRSFRIAGRLQVRYDAGMWNEWYLLFDDGGSGWLSESGDLYSLTRPADAPAALPAFDDIRAGFSLLDYGGRRFTAADVREITLSETAAEGELPFEVPARFDNRAADWRCENLFLTVDYSGGRQPESAEVFFGRMVALDELALQHTRSSDAIRAGAGRLKGERAGESCPNCGSPLEWPAGVSTTLLCPSCGSDLDVSAGRAELIAANAMRRAQEESFTIPLGSVGRFQNGRYTLIGVVRWEEIDAQAAIETLNGRKARAVREGGWTEYLLYSPQNGFYCLVEAEDGWSVSQTLRQWPNLSADGRPQGLQPLYEYGGRVAYAAGAFYWHIRSGDTNFYRDYRQGKGKLSAELSSGELAWSRSSPISHREVAAAFNLGAERFAGSGTGYDDSETSFSYRIKFVIAFLIINLPAFASMDGDAFDNVLVVNLIVFAFLLIGHLGSDDD